ncbi:uncharacterized protein B0I36DRAFT_357345 [Microdochium trichocladiopsis]|uniref:DUF7918 domain-containing protein n=1 Tax=Microdochium trichocladiopsis TaxID=1682393 RepID=A0A9P8YHA0_9PEZI|nr:uncharacterized protein B0I36DRAFT_357345 [Microdochium trichocladiopsis]KAH7039982.1 hypothetical protein B0I36DRAFT_357345 [Microdochium trichocladiopsis]
MAVIDRVPGIEVVVKVKGSTAAEHDDPEGNDSYGPDTVTKYIESVDGAEFSVVTEVKAEYDWNQPNHYVSHYVHVDGICMRNTRLSQQDVSLPYEVDGRKERQPGAEDWVLRKFKFAPVTTVDNSDPLRIDSGRGTTSDLGTIVVKVYRTIEGELITSHEPEEYKTSSLQISEKLLKGRSVSHGTALSEGEAIRAPYNLDRKLIFIDGKPFAKFRFIYRSRDALRTEMIIPRMITPEPLNALSTSNSQRLARSPLDTKTKPRVKLEPSLKRERVETIDLTGDEFESQDAKRTRRLTPIDLTGS